MADIKMQLEEYSRKLDDLQKQCAQAEKDAIVADTNYNNLVNSRQQLIEECEAFAGVSFDDIPTLLQQKQDELSAVMSRLANIDTTGPITQDKLNELDAVMSEFGIQPVE